MNRIPPALLYLTIYNPTIRPSCAVPEDNEDAEEQAQILFYTSREQAVSRDQMLRQVGLAKALVNFAENFHSTASYQNVHSQSKRMIMLSPEPNFWIHAAIELAKTPQASLSKTGKGKGKESQDGLPPPEYHDNSVHDSEVHSHLLRGYEEFKGQQALEAQLERFFTVWAWSWDLEGGPSLKMDLGLPLHHLYPAILPAIDSFTSNLPDHLTATFLTPDTIAPSTRYKSLNYPTSLIRHLMTSMKRTQVEASMTALPSSDLQSVINGTGTPSVADPHLSNGFLGISSMAIDIRKWGWTGGFSLSRSPDKKAGVSTPAHYESPPRSTVDGVVTPFDQGALEDAVSNNSFGSAEKEEKQIIHEMAPPIGDMEPLDHPGQQEPQPRDVDTPRPSRVPSPTSVLSEAPPNSHSQMGNEVASIIQFTPITVYIAPNDDPLATCRHTILLLKASGDCIFQMLFGRWQYRLPDFLKKSRASYRKTPSGA
ncbi:hypothetical protein ID866_8674 [Astraeus odoratus]|nr:hypothetical protein ID866_8674 [Astraeus odoratus]